MRALLILNDVSRISALQGMPTIAAEVNLKKPSRQVTVHIALLPDRSAQIRAAEPTPLC